MTPYTGGYRGRSLVEVVHSCSALQGAHLESCQKANRQYNGSLHSLLSSRLKFTATVCLGPFSTASLLPQGLVGIHSPQKNVPGSAQIWCRWWKRNSELLAGVAHTELCDKMTSPVPRGFLSLSKPGLCLLPIPERISGLKCQQFWICRSFALLTVCGKQCPVECTDS